MLFKEFLKEKLPLDATKCCISQVHILVIAFNELGQSRVQNSSFGQFILEVRRK